MSCLIENFCKNDPPIPGDRKFLASSPFLLTFSVIDAQRGGLHLFFGHHKQWAFLETLP
jgi:hypothetical protein